MEIFDWWERSTRQNDPININSRCHWLPPVCGWAINWNLAASRPQLATTFDFLHQSRLFSITIHFSFSLLVSAVLHSSNPTSFSLSLSLPFFSFLLSSSRSFVSCFLFFFSPLRLPLSASSEKPKPTLSTAVEKQSWALVDPIRKEGDEGRTAIHDGWKRWRRPSRSRWKIVHRVLIFASKEKGATWSLDF